MKYSQFNSLLPYQEKYILYNSLSQKVLLLNESLQFLFNDIQTDIYSVKDRNPSLYNSLLKNKFWIDKDIDELNIVKEKITQIDSNSERYMLTINPTMNCNFKCWYCYEDHIKGSQVSEENLLKIKKCIQNIVQTNDKLKHFTLTFFGGEPLLYFQQVCVPLIDEWNWLTSRYRIEKSLGFTTNGYLINDEIISCLQKHADYTSMQITLDGYEEEHDKVRYVSQGKGSYQKIVENVVKLTNSGFRVTLRINYTYDKLGSCYKILSDLNGIEIGKKKNITISFHCVWQESYNMKDKQNELFQQMSYFTAAGFTVNSPMNLRTVEQMCYADKKNTAVVNYNGDVFKCTARKFDTPLREGLLDEGGCIIWNENKINARMSSKLKNKSCQTCRILPHCFGGCTQTAMEALSVGKEYCVHNFDEKKIDAVILDHIQRLLELQQHKSATSV